jgi:hypothetical protein
MYPHPVQQKRKKKERMHWLEINVGLIHIIEWKRKLIPKVRNLIKN